MDSAQDSKLRDKLQQFANQVDDLKELCTNEVQTRATLINPYLEMLGIQVSNPRVVKLEFKAAYKGQSSRADYVVTQDDQSVLIIEAKPAGARLDDQVFGQLDQYAVNSDTVIIAAMTNGTIWKWYMKRVGGDKLEEEPFLVNDTSEPKPSEFTWLSALSRNAEDWVDIAIEQSTDRKLKDWIVKQRHNPDEGLIRHVTKELLGSDIKNYRERIYRMWDQSINAYFDDEIKRVVKLGLASSSSGDNLQDESDGTAPVEVATPDPQTQKLMTKDGEVELGKGLRRAWRAKNEEFWVIESSMINVCKALLLQLGDLHDDGLHDFLTRIGEAGLKIVKNKSEVSEDPNGNTYYTDLHANWCYFKNENNSAKIQRLRESSVYCISGKKSIDFDSHFEIWEPS